MPYRHQSHLEQLSPEEKELALRIIGGSHKLWQEFSDARSHASRYANVLNRKLLTRLTREKFEKENGHRFLYPSLTSRGLHLVIHTLRGFSAVFDYRGSRSRYLRQTESPDASGEVTAEAINLQEVQKPTLAAFACVDSRLQISTLFSMGAGGILLRREVSCGLESQSNPGQMTAKAANFLGMAIEQMGVQKVVCVTHGKCGGIAKAHHFYGTERPDNSQRGAQLLWDFAQAKAEVFQQVAEKGEDYFLSRLATKTPHKTEEDRHLQAVEIADTLRYGRMLRQEAVKFNGGKDVTIATFYMDLRTMNPHMLILPANDNGVGNDWKLLQLTNHPPIPCEHRVKRMPWEYAWAQIKHVTKRKPEPLPYKTNGCECVRQATIKLGDKGTFKRYTN